MNNTQRPDFYDLWVSACEPYGKNFIPTANALEFIFNTLRNYEISDIRRALQAHMLNPDEGRFAPKPADLIRYMVGDSASLAQRAWTKVLTAIESIGPYQSIVFDDAAVMAVVRDMGGWLEFTKFTNEELPFKQNEFITRYRGFLNHPPVDFPKVFLGLEDAERGKSGREYTLPRLWGDAEKCRLVYELGGNQNKSSATRLNIGANVVRLVGKRHEA